MEKKRSRSKDGKKQFQGGKRFKFRDESLNDEQTGTHSIKNFKFKKLDKKDKDMKGSASGNKFKSEERGKRFVPGEKESFACYYCGDKGHRQSECKLKVCFHCRETGHSLKTCPKKKDGPASRCFNCGDETHTLKNCDKPKIDGGTQFAECFVCGEKGHLASKCSQNKNGVYPKGGCCAICKSVEHLSYNCPDKLPSKFVPKKDDEALEIPKNAKGDDDEEVAHFEEEEEVAFSQVMRKEKDPPKPKPKVVNF